MANIALIFPHQLFQHHPALKHCNSVTLVEEQLFFQQISFHKHKLILHRASMQFYAAWLKHKNVDVIYIESIDERADVGKLIASLRGKKIETIHIAEVADCWLMKKIQTACITFGIKLIIHPSPGFLNTENEGRKYLADKKKYFQTDFYIFQRKQRQLLLDENKKPAGGQWSFDADNRERYPKNQQSPAINLTETNSFIDEACSYVDKHFPKNPGSTKGPYFFTVDFNSTKDWLHEFLKYRFKDFGKYEDAIVAKEFVLHHSVLSPMINIGLITPEEIVSETLAFASQNNIPLNSTEGFIRQIIGWREFIRMVYETAGSRQRTTNYWNFKRKIPASFYDGTTGIVPIDITIKKVLQTGYCHHIERLMVLGNFMLLCEFDPDEVYRWFMELFIDAYDWVMVPNIYGMTQFADGGLMTSKPYISGSNYLMKMSDYEKGAWQQIWDGLFWRFMHVHRDFFTTNPRLGMLVKTFDKMNEEKRNTHLLIAEKYLDSL
jgi:deoxyribodipyrimidine photolyase-related protein